MPYTIVLISEQRTDDPKEGGLLTPDGAVGLPTDSIRDYLLRCVFIFAL